MADQVTIDVVQQVDNVEINVTPTVSDVDIQATQSTEAVDIQASSTTNSITIDATVAQDNVTVTTNDPDMTYVTDLVYDAQNRMIETHRSNGLSKYITYDEFDRIATMRIEFGQYDISLVASYDGLGNLTGFTPV
tara:strand:+ start:7309 stop:7713 length:405 start_codon:yes stop_codon:yes gene_type:complete